MTPDPNRTKSIADFLDGNRDPESFRRVESWIVDDPRNLREFVDQLQVAEDLRRASLHDDVSRYTNNRASRHGTTAAAAGNKSKLRRFGLGVLAIACCLLLVLTTYLVMNPPAAPSSEQIATANSAEEPAIVATLGEMRDCRWDGAKQGMASGHLFTLGSALNLLAGAAQITFETGVTSIIEGPAQVTLRDNAIELHRGRVSAVVPDSASGFTVLTPTSEVIDLGTEFGVSVDDQGASQVHVFLGEVVTRSRNAAGETVGEPIFVTTHNAIQFGPDTAQAKRLVADEEAFARMLADPAIPQASFSPPVNGPLLLWLTAGHWIVDDEQRITVWRDAQCSENSVPDNALQADPEARPRVVENSIGGLPAAHFDGVDDFLVTTPFQSGDNQTVVIVASILGTSDGSPNKPHEAPQIINYNGPPQLDAKWYSAPNILEVVAKLDDQNRILVNPYIYMGWRGRKPKSPVFVGDLNTETNKKVASSLPSMGDPFVAVYVYDHDANHSKLWINNQRIGNTTAPAPISLTSRKVIGRHGGFPWQFFGDVAEVMIYDVGLDDASVKTLSSSLAKKYNIPLVE